MQKLDEIFTSWYSMPILPTSILVSALILYWLIVLVGALDLEFLDWDFELHLETDANLLDVGLVPLRFLNLGRIPVMIWTSLYCLSAWITTIVIHNNWIVKQAQTDGIVIAESFAIALVITKLITNPLNQWFDIEEPNRPETLIGRTCTITTLQATEATGEASFGTGGAPLTLTVRTLNGELACGQSAEIMKYDRELNAYLVRGTTEEN